MPTYNNIHRQQLFHWIGGHIDERATGTRQKLNDPLREEYLDCVRGVLNHGLWVKTPRVPDFLGKGDLIKVTRPITCFTEWTLGQSLPHTTRYGRLGFGLPKKFVLARGGAPLIYVRDISKHDPYTTALKSLARLFKESDLEGVISPKKLTALRKHFDYLSHFNKRIKQQLVPSAVATTKAKTKSAFTGKPLRFKPVDPFLRKFGSTLHFLEEREWRIVYDESIESFFTDGPGGPGPNYYLPIKPGRELFTLVLPDNKTVSMAMHDKTIQKALFPVDAPHVTVLSLQDIGTF